MDFGEIAREISARWKKIKPDEKKKYQALADIDKKRYEKAKAEYEAKKAAAGEEEEEEEEDAGDKEEAADDADA